MYLLGSEDNLCQFFPRVLGTQLGHWAWQQGPLPSKDLSDCLISMHKKDFRV